MILVAEPALLCQRGAPTFISTGEYFDVALSRRSTFRKVVLSVGHTDGGDLLSW